MSKHRLELFSDAVMAIILTIMVLDLKAPAEGGWHAWVPVLPSVAIYLLGFLVVASIWVIHHQYFARFQVINPQILWANFVLLFGLSLVPLMVRAMADHPHDRADTVAFLINTDCIVLCTTWIRLAAKRDHGNDPEFQEWFKTRSKHAVIFLLAMPVQLLVAVVSPVCAQILVGALILAGMISNTGTEHRDHASLTTIAPQPDDAALSLQ